MTFIALMQAGCFSLFGQSPVGSPTPGPSPTPATYSLPSTAGLPAKPATKASPALTPLSTPLVGPASVPLSPPYRPLPFQSDARLDTLIRGQLDHLEAYGVVVKRLPDGIGVSINSNRSFNAASLYKLWVMYEVFKQRNLGLLDFDEELTMTPYYAQWDLGTLGWDLWRQVSIGQLLEAMITYSDNASAVLLLDKVGAWNVVADMRSLGLASTRFVDEMPITTAADMALLLEMIASYRAVDEESSRQMIQLMLGEQFEDRLVAMLPPEIQVAHKTGTWDDATHDVGRSLLSARPIHNSGAVREALRWGYHSDTIALYL